VGTAHAGGVLARVARYLESASGTSVWNNSCSFQTAEVYPMKALVLLLFVFVLGMIIGSHLQSSTQERSQ
jgi:hypothetical protein